MFFFFFVPAERDFRILSFSWVTKRKKLVAKNHPGAVLLVAGGLV
jgi:hypothetical protein